MPGNIFQRLACALLCALTVCWVPSAATAAGVQVQATRNGDGFEVSASGELDASLEIAWEVLTDYDRLSEFIPGMHSSKVVSREGDRVLVDQRGEAGLLFFHFPIEVRLAIVETRPERIESRAVSGNFKELRGAYRLESEGGRLRLSYEGRFTPDFDIPSFIGTMVVRHTLEQRFGAMLGEIERRQANRQ